ncbi:MAG: cache domain-containing protein, partial [Deltaproteobacteria bacterium]|nr:cache domain-containing protein [Deltaproteobacteria bacterium]
MKIRFSIFTKLLTVILPLVCLPIAIVGYFSFQASVDRVDRLVRHEQKVKAEALAQEINDIFFYTQFDLKLIASLPILEDYSNSRLFGLNAATDFNRNAILKLFINFIKRAGHYFQIRYLDRSGQEVIKQHRDLSDYELEDQGASDLFKYCSQIGKDDIDDIYV